MDSSTHRLVKLKLTIIKLLGYDVTTRRCLTRSVQSQLSDPEIRTYKLTDFQLADMLVRSLESLCFLHL